MSDSIFVLLLSLAAALFALIKGADCLVENSSDLARRLRIQEMLIGFTIVAFGTSLPELVVTINAALKGRPEMAFGNVIGSNIANILLILGACALVHPLRTSEAVRKDLRLSLTMIVLVAVMLVFGFQRMEPLSASSLTFTATNGYILLAFFAIFLFLSIYGAEKAIEEEISRSEHKQTYFSLGMIAVGLLLVLVGGHYTVESAVSLARKFNVSEAVIGLTVIAFGTSLPELVASLVASIKRHNELAIGNVLGSNLFNLAGILGFALTMNPIATNIWGLFDILFMLVVSLVLVALLWLRRKQVIGKFGGLIFIIIYGLYTWFALQRDA